MFVRADFQTQIAVLLSNANAFLPFREGFSVSALDIHPDHLQLTLVAEPNRPPLCGACQQPCARVDEANLRRHDKPARRLIKQARWLLLRNPENLSGSEQQIHRQELLTANPSRMTVYLMKAQLKSLWTPRTAWGWRAAWKQWLPLPGKAKSLH